MTEHYLEDFAIGQTFHSGRLRVDAGAIKTFAAAFDPQLFIWTKRLPGNRFFAGWPPAAGTPPR